LFFLCWRCAALWERRSSTGAWLQGCSSASRWWGASWAAVSPPTWVGVRLFFQHSEDDHQPCEGGRRAEPWLHPSCPPTLWNGKRAVLRLHLFGFDGFGTASDAASHRQAGHGCPSFARAIVAPCAGPPHPWRPLRRRPYCSDAAWGVVQDIIRRGGGGRVLGWSCPHPRRRTGARTSSPVLGWSPLLASLSE
jgi:hypothetical protein